MMESYIHLTTHVIDEYQERLRISDRNARVQNLARDTVMRLTIGQMIVSLGKHVQGQRSSPAAIAESADVRWAR